MTDLEMLISELQSEHDHLEQEMNKCIKNWDFVGAENFKHPLIFTREQLDILKSIQNPNYKKTKRLELSIIKYNEMLNSTLPYKSNQFKRKFLQKRVKLLLETATIDLAEIKKIKALDQTDNDNLLENIDLLIKDCIQSINLQFRNEKIKIAVERNLNGHIQIVLTGEEQNKVDDYLHYGTKKRLKKIGFLSTENSYTKDLNKINSGDDVLTIISILVFEVLKFSGDIELEIID